MYLDVLILFTLCSCATCVVDVAVGVVGTLVTWQPERSWANRFVTAKAQASLQYKIN